MRWEKPVDVPRAMAEGCRLRVSRDREDMARAYGIYLDTWNGRRSVDCFHGIYGTQPNGLYLLLRGEEPIAFFILAVRANGKADIEYFAVRRDCRGRGYGTVFLQHALPMIRAEADPADITLTVHTDNDPAIRLYESAGFRRLYRMTAFQRALGT